MENPIQYLANASLDIKLTRAQAWKHINELAQGARNDADAAQFSLADLAPLFSHFIPAAVRLKKSFDAYEWVAQAAAPKTDVRPYLQHVYCSGDHIVATDGHRLHAHPNTEGLEPGYYCTQTRQRIDESATYPDYMRVSDRSVARVIEPTPQARNLHKGVRGLYVPEADLGVDERYWKQALAFEVRSPMQTLVAGPDGGRRFYIAFDNGAWAVVMPIRL